MTYATYTGNGDSGQLRVKLIRQNWHTLPVHMMVTLQKTCGLLFVQYYSLLPTYIRTNSRL